LGRGGGGVTAWDKVQKFVSLYLMRNLLSLRFRHICQLLFTNDCLLCRTCLLPCHYGQVNANFLHAYFCTNFSLFADMIVKWFFCLAVNFICFRYVFSSSTLENSFVYFMFNKREKDFWSLGQKLLGFLPITDILFVKSRFLKKKKNTVNISFSHNIKFSNFINLWNLKV